MALRLTARDRELLAFAAGHRFVLAAQVAQLLAMSVRAADARIRALRHAGYLESERTFDRAPATHRITAAGLRVAGSTLPAPRGIDPALHDHDAALGWLELAARRGRFGAAVDIVTERRMRSHDGRSSDRSERYGVWLGGVGPGGRDRMHHPDLIVDAATGHRVAFELELTTKSPRRREQILSAYAADPRIDAVVYLVERRQAGLAIQRSAARLGISDLIHVQPVSLTPPERAGVRGAARHRQRGSGRAEQPAAAPRRSGARSAVSTSVGAAPRDGVERER